MKDENYVAVILEEVRDQYGKIMEGLDSIRGLPRQVSKLQDDMTEVKSDIKVIKAVVTNQSQQLSNHEDRITVLETA